MPHTAHKQRREAKEDFSGLEGIDFVAPGKLSGFFESSGDGAIFFFTELNGLLDAGLFQFATEAKEDVEFGPHARGFGSAFAGADHFEGFKFLALFFEDDDDVGGGAGAEGHEEELHGAGGSEMVGIEGDGMAGRADGDKLLLANPLNSRGLHVELLMLAGYRGGRRGASQGGFGRLGG